MGPKTFIFTGRSGCGKGTQASLLIDDYAHEGQPSYRIESGAMFRSFISEHGYTNALAADILNSGKLQPEFLSIWVWSNLLIRDFQDPSPHLVLDGMPRRIHEAPVLDGALDFYDRAERFVIYLNVSRKWSEDRLRARKRDDDVEQYIQNRLDWFESEVMKVIEFFKKNTKYTFLDINGEQPIEKVRVDIAAAINAHSKH